MEPGVVHSLKIHYQRHLRVTIKYLKCNKFTQSIEIVSNVWPKRQLRNVLNMHDLSFAFSMRMMTCLSTSGL